MDLKLFDPKSRRSQLARIGHGISPWILTIEISVIFFLVAGFALLYFGFSLGWAFVGLAAIPAMIVDWYKYELRDVPAVKDGKRIDDLLETELLGLLPPQPSPKDIASAIGRTNSGNFFGVRFGVGGGFLEQLSSDDRAGTQAVFTEALAIAEKTDGRLTSGALIVALVRQLPSKTTLLGHLQLSDEDLIEGIRWYHRILDAIQASRTRTKRAGGIGRDWSFGWIPTLSQFGTSLAEIRPPLHSVHSELLDETIRALEGNTGTIALVGPDGAGKTEAVYQLAGMLMNSELDIPAKLRYHQIFLLDASRLVSAVGERGDLERLMNTLLGEAYTAKNIILCLDNAHLFFEDGVGSTDISNLLLPVIQGGALPLILTMDEQRFLQISKSTPALANSVNRIHIASASEADTLAILQEKLPFVEYRHKVTFMYQALKEAYHLGKRYVYDTAMPGQAIALLDGAAEHAEDGYVTAKSVSLAIEKTVGVKTSAVDDETERETLLNLESLIHQRMIGQDKAVAVVADALRRARAGVRNQKRPVGTFLFLGPTGVGKTELAKSLAAVYFGGEDRIIRLDMNEFVSSDDVARLIADGADDAGSLTAQVMKQPFSVVLLDEIEKAHSSVLTTLLQLLDEGILRDVRNREISFRDTIVIATSNAGADRIQEYIHRGYDMKAFETKFVDELLGSQIFHPEFLNRFDELLVFRPLEKSELLQVVDLILKGVNANLEQQKISVTVAPEAKEYLVEAGYDPRLGARPMRRVVQKAVESTVAKLMLSRQLEAGGTVEITLEQVQSILDSHTQAEEIISESK